MTGLIYPRMAYRLDRPYDPGIIIGSRSDDERLGPEWDDTYGVRSVADQACPETVEEAPTQTPPAPRRGRPKKVAK